MYVKRWNELTIGTSKGLEIRFLRMGHFITNKQTSYAYKSAIS